MAFLFLYGGRLTVCDPYHTGEKQPGADRDFGHSLKHLVNAPVNEAGRGYWHRQTPFTIVMNYGLTSTFSLSPRAAKPSRHPSTSPHHRVAGATGVSVGKGEPGAEQPARQPCWTSPLAGPSGASLSSRTRKRFHTADRSGSDLHQHRCEATRTDASNLSPKAASKSSWPDRLIAAPPTVEPTREKWFGSAVQQVLNSR
jgi:hypothetical protein